MLSGLLRKVLHTDHHVVHAMCSCCSAIGDLYNFHLDPSLTLGCGSWGSTSVSANVGPQHLINIKTGGRPVDKAPLGLLSFIYLGSIRGCICRSSGVILYEEGSVASCAGVNRVPRFAVGAEPLQGCSGNPPRLVDILSCECSTSLG
jgi:hypothetical protein